MPDFLTRRHGMWHFVRRVPREFAAVDRRGVTKHSTKIKVSDDRTGRRAFRVAQRLNQELELLWQRRCGGGRTAELSRYDQARQHACSIGFDYIENDVLVLAPRRSGWRLWFAKGLISDPATRAALGAERRPAFELSRLFEEYQAIIGDEIKSLSPDQVRIWKNGRVRAVERFVGLIGDKPVTELTDGDALD